jgi:CubicO group peptidase (beta-lactamase class C family)
MFKKYFKTEWLNLWLSKFLPAVHEKMFRIISNSVPRKVYLNLFFTLLIAVIFCQYSFSQISDSTISNKINTLIQLLYSREQFNGSILVSRNEKVVYEKAYGKADIKNDIEFSLSTPCYLASVSKQFTAIGILILVQKKLITLDDYINKYFPDFPNGDSITIKQLLNHTSGIVNYEELGIDRPGLTNQDVYNSLVQHKTLQFHPGEKYDYSNSGYVLSAMIIEQVSKMSFVEFMKKYVFEPLQMTNTFIYDKSAQNQKPVTKAYGKFGDESDAISNTTGDGGICSTVADLFEWDKALYTNKLVSQELLGQAFAPATLNNGTKSLYGLGWMIKDDSSNKIVYHTGGSGGYRTYIERNLDNHNAIIILTNIENSPRRELSQAIENILDNKSYSLPKIPVATKMHNIRNSNGIDSAIQFYNSNKINNPDKYDFSEQELNLLGYKFWSLNNIDEALKIFNLNVIAYPSSSNAYESLGEAYLKKGDKEQAEICFNKSLKLDATNQDAIRMLKQMK